MLRIVCTSRGQVESDQGPKWGIIYWKRETARENRLFLQTWFGFRTFGREGPDGYGVLLSPQAAILGAGMQAEAVG